MKRLTERGTNGTAMAACCGENCKYNFCCENSGFAECGDMDDIIDRLAAIEDILGDEYALDWLRELVELYKNVPHICDYCIGCEIEPTDGHGCDGYDSFVFSVRRIVAALKARERDE